MAEVLETVELSGFDPASEPTIHVMPDGALQVWFEYMPRRTWTEAARTTSVIMAISIERWRRRSACPWCGKTESHSTAITPRPAPWSA
jgi:hypothetical protein